MYRTSCTPAIAVSDPRVRFPELERRPSSGYPKTTKSSPGRLLTVSEKLATLVRGHIGGPHFEADLALPYSMQPEL
jgi:hypothetical protein